MTQARARDSRKIWMAVGGGVLAILVAVLIAVSVTGGKDDAELVGVADARALVEGIPSEGLVLGKADAPVTIMEFLDLQCPHCAAASKTVVPDLVEQYVRPGRAHLQMLPLALFGNTANGEKANRAVYAAGRQGKAWLFVEILYANQGAEGSDWLDDDMVTSIAEAAGLDMARFETDRQSPEADTTMADAAAKMRAQTAFDGTPAFLVHDTATNLEVFLGAADATPAGFDAAIARVSGGD